MPDIYLPAQTAAGKAKEAARAQRQAGNAFLAQSQAAAKKPAPSRLSTLRDGWRRFTGRR